MKLLKQFPSNSRIITELKSFYIYISVLLSAVVILVLVILTGFVAYNFSQNFVKFQVLNSQKNQIEGKISFWNSIADKYPGYADAYFNIAILYYEISDFQNSRSYLEKTLVLNPDYKGANKLDSNLRTKGY